MSRFTLLPADRTSGDILLVNADFSRNLLGQDSELTGSLGMTRLATYLAAKGLTPAILDAGGHAAGSVTAADFADELLALAPQFRVIGFHIHSWNISSTTEVVAKLPRDTRVLFGGPLATGQPHGVIDHFGKVGFENVGVVAGYGETLTHAALSTDEWENIPELYTRGHDGRHQQPRSDEIATWPLIDPVYSPYLTKIYEPILTRGTLGETPMGAVFQAFGLDVNHGCPFDCAYCSLPAYGRTGAEYAPARVVREMMKLGDECGVFSFTFTNSNLLFTRRAWLIDFLAELERSGVREWATWTGYHHPFTINLLSVDDLKRMREAGCDDIVVGVQTIDPVVAKIFHRPENSWEVLKEIRAKTCTVGQSLVIDYITGVPGEDLQKIADFFAWCEEEEIECRSYQLKIYPETQLAKVAHEWTATHDIVPITGELAGTLDGFAVIPKVLYPAWFTAAEERLRTSNKRVNAKRPVRIGARYIRSEADAKDLLADLPQLAHTPEKVKTMQSILINAMFAPAKTMSTFTDQPSVASMMRTVVLADETSPPMVRAMHERFKKEMGEEAFERLRQKMLTEK